jgi:hypothetical protein
MCCPRFFSGAAFPTVAGFILQSARNTWKIEMAPSLRTQLGAPLEQARIGRGGAPWSARAGEAVLAD